MYNSNDLSLDAASTNVCQHCGNPTITFENTAGAKKSGIIYPIAGWLFSIIALLILPILFGALAFSMGLITFYARNRAHGIALMIFSSFSLIFGSLLSLVVSGTVFF